MRSQLLADCNLADCFIRLNRLPKCLFVFFFAQEEVHVMLFEPKSTLNTGNVVEERTKTNLEQI
jgi:hypothetical protein